ncbi:MAG TPA: bifunctional diaminohydroxyphosphoribosylaminopyrimidine deaminase/5-amino-6-(5-phosphoribosylamino)uracil reductase RibD [Bdellovibrionales bacterium]|nr:bifunctional diaminohydroxyphosphoribosylaminopyrimidine deaminase/5-amino-6-(5-phosphoribosylamino)uracil reductase RibD [Bdellovibrionales bacterium]
MALLPLEAMRLAIQEGKKGAGFVSPNPLVGCVILDRERRLLAKGHHARVGQDHAEAAALREIEDPNRLDGAHVYVTLEPCAHEGRTASCAKALARLPIASVTYGLQDPNPLVSGKGAEILRSAGKRVDLFADLQDELEELAEIFLLNQRRARPFVALKVASTLDGRVAMHDGTSRWITGEASRDHVHYLRGCYDAVLTGVGTFLRDDPRLNSRHGLFAAREGKVVLLDPEGESFSALGKSGLSSVYKPENMFIVTGQGVSAPPVGRQIVATDRGDRDFDLPGLLMVLREEGINSVFVEAGPLTASSFLRAQLVDRLYLYLAPKLMGDGLSWSSALKVRTLDLAPSLKNPRWEGFGQDMMVTGRL